LLVLVLAGAIVSPSVGFDNALRLGLYLKFHRIIPNQEAARVKHSLLRSILTDVHFWVPLIVLVFGTALLMVLR